MPKIVALDGTKMSITSEALEMLDDAVWIGAGGQKFPIIDMPTHRLHNCLRIIEEGDYGADCREAIELELEIRRFGLRGPFFRDTTRPEE